MKEKQEEKLSRKVVRYHLSRWQTDMAGGSKKPDTDTMKKVQGLFEKNQWYNRLGGIDNFGKTWDVSPNDAYAMIPRDKTLLEEWNAELKKSVKEMPKKPEVKGMPFASKKAKDDSMKL